MEPLLTRMICREMDSPMPLPSSLVVKKGMKICVAMSGGIGSPSSLMSMTTDSSVSEKAWRLMCCPVLSLSGGLGCVFQ